MSASFAASLAVPPRVEGAYELDKKDLRRPPFLISKPLVIMNTLSNRGVIISFADPSLGNPHYLFQAIHVSEDGYAIEGVSMDGDLAEIKVEIDRETRNLMAWVRDPRKGDDFTVQGEQRFSTAPYFRNPTKPLAPKYLQGQFAPPAYTGEAGTLYISQSAARPDLWQGQWVTHAGSRVGFQHAVADLERRNLQLVSVGPRHFQKWIFAVAANEETEEVTLVGMRLDAAWGKTPGLTYVRK